MKNKGKQFEDDFKASVPKDVYYLRLHDSATGFSFSENESPIRFSLKSPYDAVLCRNGKMVCVELKSVGSVSASFSGNSPVIKMRQITALLDAKKRGGADSFLVINFRRFHETYAIKPDDFLDWVKKCDRKSLPVDTARKIGIRIPEKQRRVRSRYDLSVLF